MYNKIFKNNQVTYGRPFQIKIPLKLQNIAEQSIETEGTEFVEDIQKKTLEPEELLEKAKRECELLLDEAGFEAERIMEQARQEAEKKAEVMLEEAWQMGYAEGAEAARAQNKSILEETEKLYQIAVKEHDSTLAGLESEILELVLGVAHKAVAGELVMNSDIILQLIKDALPNCSNTNGAILKVSPIDYNYLIDNKERLSTIAEGADGLEIRKDPTLKAGDCIIETALGGVDAGVDTRLYKIEEAFREQLKGI